MQVSATLFALLGLHLKSTALAWSTPSKDNVLSTSNALSSTRELSTHSDNGMNEEQDRIVGRRGFLRWAAIGSVVLCSQCATSQSSRANAMDGFCSDSTTAQASSTDPNQPLISSPTVTIASSQPTGHSPHPVEIEPSLRASYYYPTAKKRYLPRIQKVSTAIRGCKNALLMEDWETVQLFAKTAEDAILPLQLYASSLDGQGLSQSTSFAKVMRQDALDYEKAYKNFDQALRKRDSPTALQAVSEMDVAVADYRQAGRLKDDDGNIPSIDEIKSMAAGRGTFV